MSNIKASTLRNRRQDNENALDKINAKILSGNNKFEIEYEIVDGIKS